MFFGWLHSPTVRVTAYICLQAHECQRLFCLNQKSFGSEIDIMNSSLRLLACKTDPNKFCYVCGLFITEKRQNNFTNKLPKGYLQYFGIGATSVNQTWTPSLLCNSCNSKLFSWASGSKLYVLLFKRICDSICGHLCVLYKFVGIFHSLHRWFGEKRSITKPIVIFVFPKLMDLVIASQFSTLM